MLDSGVRNDTAAVDVLRDDLASRYGIHLETASKSGSVSKPLSDGDQPGFCEDWFRHGLLSRQVGRGGPPSLSLSRIHRDYCERGTRLIVWGGNFCAIG